VTDFFPGKLSLTAGDIQELFTLCAFSSITPENKAWCSTFTDNDIDILNYWTDLENYYSSSYGNKFSYQIGCPLMADIIDTINKYIKEGFPFGIFRFAHSSSVLTLQSLLDLYHDPFVLTSSNYKQYQRRLFNIYNILPMSGNIAFVLNKCGSSYKIQVLVNERLVTLPCCASKGQGNDTCDLDTFKSCFEHIGLNCNFKAMCSINVSSASWLSGPTLWLILIITFINLHICLGRTTDEVINDIVLIYRFLIINNFHRILTLFGMMIAASVMLIMMLIVLMGVMAIIMTIVMTIITLIISGIAVSFGICRQTWAWNTENA